MQIKVPDLEGLNEPDERGPRALRTAELHVQGVSSVFNHWQTKKFFAAMKPSTP